MSPARLLTGRPIAQRIGGETAERAAALRARGITPALAILQAGGDPAANAYAARLERSGSLLGVSVERVALPADVTEPVLVARLSALGADPRVHGVLLLTPLPAHLDEYAMEEHLPPAKDVDGQHPLNAGHLVDGRPQFVPSTADAAVELLRYYGIPLDGARATIVGRSTVVGRPLAHLLLLDDATVTLAHSRTRDLARHTRDADIVIVAVGRAGFLTGEMVAPGATVIDAGINVTPHGIVGDADESVAKVAGALSPVPGGLGAVTTTLLLRNVVRAAEGSGASPR